MKEAIEQMKLLDEAARRKTLLSALRRASRPFISAAKRLAPQAENNVREFWGKRLNVEPGTLKRSIRAIVPKRKSDQLTELLIGPTKAKAGARRKMTEGGINRNDGWFRHFVIRGTAGATIKKGKNAGRYIPGQQANPFVDKAYNQSGGQVSDELEKAIVNNIS